MLKLIGEAEQAIVTTRTTRLSRVLLVFAGCGIEMTNDRGFACYLCKPAGCVHQPLPYADSTLSRFPKQDSAVCSRSDQLDLNFLLLNLVLDLDRTSERVRERGQKHLVGDCAQQRLQEHDVPIVTYKGAYPHLELSGISTLKPLIADPSSRLRVDHEAVAMLGPPPFVIDAPELGASEPHDLEKGLLFSVFRANRRPSWRDSRSNSELGAFLVTLATAFFFF